MAEGGEDFGIEQPDLDNRLANDANEGDEVNRTQPFQPNAASTPYGAQHEQIEMQTMQEEHSGPPDKSFDENFPLLDDFSKTGGKIDRLRNTFFGFVRETEPLTPTAVINFVKKGYPQASDYLLKRIGIRGVQDSGGGPNDVIVVSPKGGV